jgi:hypothetical protein
MGRKPIHLHPGLGTSMDNVYIYMAMSILFLHEDFNRDGYHGTVLVLVYICNMYIYIYGQTPTLAHLPSE